MPSMISQRVHRILRRLESFRAPGSAEATKEEPGSTRVDRKPEALGELALRLSDGPGRIVIREGGIEIHTASEPTTIAYGQIEDVSLETPTSKAFPTVQIRLRNGQRHAISGFHATGRLSDAYEFVRFLSRARTDSQASSNGSEGH